MNNSIKKCAVIGVLSAFMNSMTAQAHMDQSKSLNPSSDAANSHDQNLLAPETVELIRKLAEQGVLTFEQSTGQVVLTDEVIDALIESGEIDDSQIAMDGTVTDGDTF